MTFVAALITLVNDPIYGWNIEHGHQSETGTTLALRSRRALITGEMNRDETFGSLNWQNNVAWSRDGKFAIIENENELYGVERDGDSLFVG